MRTVLFWTFQIAGWGSVLSGQFLPALIFGFGALAMSGRKS